MRGSRDFAHRAAYDRFLHKIVSQRNLTRQVRWTQQMDRACRPMPQQTTKAIELWLVR
jgi:hypothetical protein